MKKIKLLICMMMLAITMFSVTGCGSSDNSTNETTTVAPSTTMETTLGSSTNGTDTGVIEGLVDDVEKGVDDMTGNNNSSKAADESR